MDGITGSPTLGGVVLATISGAAYAVFKVSVCAQTAALICFLFVLPFATSHFCAGDVPEIVWRSASSNDLICIYNNRFNKFNTLLAHPVGLISVGHRVDAIREFILDCFVNCLHFNVE